MTDTHISPPTGSTGRYRRDPRSDLSARDLNALRFIGECGEVAQYQLHAAVFGAVSEVVVSRFIKRASALQLVAVTRWRRVGINRVRLTSKGRKWLVSHGVEPQEIFLLQHPIAEGHVDHHLWIVDVLIVLRSSARLPDILKPCWALERRFTPRPAAIPDVLTSFSSDSGNQELLLAIEVDRASESLSIFVAKLHKLCEVLRNWAAEARVAIVILTTSVRRSESLRKTSSEFNEPTFVQVLPPAAGRPALSELKSMLAFP